MHKQKSCRTIFDAPAHTIFGNFRRRSIPQIVRPCIYTSLSSREYRREGKTHDASAQILPKEEENKDTRRKFMSGEHASGEFLEACLFPTSSNVRIGNMAKLIEQQKACDSFLQVQTCEKYARTVENRWCICGHDDGYQNDEFCWLDFHVHAKLVACVLKAAELYTAMSASALVFLLLSSLIWAAHTFLSRILVRVSISIAHKSLQVTLLVAKLCMYFPAKNHQKLQKLTGKCGKVESGMSQNQRTSSA